MKAVQAYLTLGMPVDGRDDFNQGTPLIRAAEGGHPSVIRVLVRAGADLEARDTDDDTPDVYCFRRAAHYVRYIIGAWCGHKPTLS